MKFYEIGRNESGARIYESEDTAEFERIYVVFAEEPGTESMREFVYMGMSPADAVRAYGRVSGFNVDSEDPQVSFDVETAVNKEIFRRGGGVYGDFYVDVPNGDSGFYAYEFFE